MPSFKSIKNKIMYQVFTFPPVCYAVNGTEDVPVPAAPTDTLKLKPSPEYDNLTNITPNNFLSGVIILALNISIISFLFMLLLGGYRWITSSGDEKKLTIAKNQITHSLTGLVIILSSWLIMGLIGYLFDIDIFTWTIPSFISPPNTTP